MKRLTRASVSDVIWDAAFVAGIAIAAIGGYRMIFPQKLPARRFLSLKSLS